MTKALENNLKKEWFMLVHGFKVSVHFHLVSKVMGSTTPCWRVHCRSKLLTSWCLGNGLNGARARHPSRHPLWWIFSFHNSSPPRSLFKIWLHHRINPLVQTEPSWFSPSGPDLQIWLVFETRASLPEPLEGHFKSKPVCNKNLVVDNEDWG